MDQPNSSVATPKPGPRGKAPLIRRLATSYPELSHSSIARRVGCSQANVSEVLKRFLDNTSADELRQFQENKADIYDAIQKRALECITGKKLEKSSAPALMMVAGTLEDKKRLILGESTSNVNVHVLLEVAGMIRRDGEQ